jgi:uncharacterized membrane protein
MSDSAGLPEGGADLAWYVELLPGVGAVAFAMASVGFEALWRRFGKKVGLPQSRAAIACVYAIVSFIIFALCMLTELLAWLFTPFGAVALISTGLWYLVRSIAACIVFPGSVQLYQRYTEQQIRLEMCRQGTKPLVVLQQLRGALASPSAQRPSVQTLRRARSMLESMCTDWTAFAPDQRMLQLVEELFDWVNQPQFDLKGSVVSLEHILALPHTTAQGQLQQATLVRETALPVNELLAKFMELSQTAPLTLDGIRQLYKGQAMGSLEMVRAQLLKNHPGSERFTARGNGAVIDGVFLPAKGPKVVLYCQPNAGFYEMIDFSTTVSFYHRYGVSVCAFNYAGYNESQGRTSLDGLQRDVELVLEWLCSRGYHGKIAVHGRSIGGVPAVHLAATAAPGAIVGIVTDRTFGTLASVAENSWGGWARHALWFARLQASNAKNFCATQVPKIAIVDPADAVIPASSSLAVEVSMELASRPLDLSIGEAVQAWHVVAAVVNVHATSCRKRSKRTDTLDIEEGTNADPASVLWVEPDKLLAATEPFVGMVQDCLDCLNSIESLLRTRMNNIE